HGGNRLGGNSLAEIVTFGAITGGHVAEYVEDAPREPVDDEELEDHLRWLEELRGSDGEHDPHDIIEELRAVMWEHAGIIREEERLEAGLEKLEAIREKADDLEVPGDVTAKGFEYAMDLHFMLPVAEAVLRSALEREESRAAHYREDFPEERENWKKNILVQASDDGMELWTEEVPPVPNRITAALEEGHELDYHHLE
ncbi:MAG: succinate dehydrogenase, partial [Candidatus Nanohaloarchaea archaeon]|nr:succinate dehydrogenase [Candidatus Nanohaloarchaea archaeon]